MGEFAEKLAHPSKRTWLRPRDNWVLVKMIDESTTAGGLHIPGTAEHDFRTCQVLALGPGLWTDGGARLPIEDLVVGDKVIVRNLTMEQVKGMAPKHVVAGDVEGQFLVEASFIMAVLEEGGRPWETH